MIIALFKHFYLESMSSDDQYGMFKRTKRRKLNPSQQKLEDKKVGF